MVSYNSESSLTIYLRKQKKFITLVNSIQKAICSKDYRKQGYTFNSYVKKNWNISKAQAYRYLISAKILDQLKEFEILPNYERLCKTISTLTKTEEQIKLLWKVVLRKVQNRLDEIDTSFITKVWKELCKDEKYNSICHIENNITKCNEDTNKKSENKIIKDAESNSNIINNNLINQHISSPLYTENCISINNNSFHNPYYPTPSFSEIELQNINDNINDNSSQISYYPSPSYTENDLQNINEIISQDPLFSTLPVINNDITNYNMDISQQLNINSQILFNPINDCNNYNSQIDSIPQDLSYDSFDDIFTFSINELNDNSEPLYYPIPITVENSSNNSYCSINNQTSIQTVPITSPNTIYYMINTPYQQPIIISS